ncbi:MAG: hypothetical protein FJX67_11040 [Alphaproteobacteria bacterium]|nr:hypothetical protein [Alphaproteobacteria bacterium]
MARRRRRPSRLRAAIGAGVRRVLRHILAPDRVALARLSLRCKRAGIDGATLEGLGALMLARLQAGTPRVTVRAAEPVAGSQPSAAPSPEVVAAPIVSRPSVPESVVAAAAPAEPVAAPVAGPTSAVIIEWPAPRPEPVDERETALLSLRAWIDYLHTRGRLSPVERDRLVAFGSTPAGIQYLIRLRDYYEGSGPFPGDFDAGEPVRRRTGTGE